jgi:hypothetical protein
VVVLAFGVKPDLEDHGTEAASAPSNCTELFRVVTPLVNQVRLVEYLLRLFQADAMFSFDVAALFLIEAAAYPRITVISSFAQYRTFPRRSHSD